MSPEEYRKIGGNVADIPVPKLPEGVSGWLPTEQQMTTSRRQFERTNEILAAQGVCVYPLPPPRKRRA